MGIPKTSPKYTYQEYLDIEAKAELRHEYYYGEIIAMAGSSKRHNIISLNTIFALRSQLKGKKCSAFMSDVRVQVLHRSIYYYPDVVVSCDESDAENEKSVSAPILIAEVLSESTATKDMTEKLLNYMQIPSLEYYLLLAQDAITVHLYHRTETGWGVQLFTQREEMILLPKMDISLSIKDLYETVEWEEDWS